MAKIELPIFLRIENTVVDFSRVEHFRLIPMQEPGDDENWRNRTSAMIVFDIESRHYVFSFANDADAKATFEDLCNRIFPPL